MAIDDSPETAMALTTLLVASKADAVVVLFLERDEEDGQPVVLIKDMVESHGIPIAVVTEAVSHYIEFGPWKAGSAEIVEHDPS